MKGNRGMPAEGVFGHRGGVSFHHWSRAALAAANEMAAQVIFSDCAA